MKLVRDQSVRMFRLPSQDEFDYLPYEGYEHIVPIFQTVSSMGGSFYQHIWPYIGFICKSCHHPIIIKANIMTELDQTKSVNNNDDEDRYMWVDYNFNIICPDCGFYNEYECYIDPAITPALAKLNKKGYITEFSCQGHISEHANDTMDCNTGEYLYNDASNSGAYIAFKDESLDLRYNDLYRDIFTAIPPIEPWSIDENYPCMISCPVLHDNLAERIITLDAWVDCLPNVFTPNESIPTQRYMRDNILTPELLDRAAKVKANLPIKKY